MSIQAPQLQENVMTGSLASEVSKELDLSKMSLVAPVYKYRRLMQVAGGSNLTPSTSTVQSQFVIPGSSVWNFAKSYLTFDVNAPDAGATLYNSLFTDTLPIDYIQLQTDTGTVLANIQNVQAYLKAAQHLTTPMDEFTTRSPIYGNANVALFPINICFGCNPCGFDGNGRTTSAFIPSVPSNASIVDSTGGTQAAAIASANPCNASSGTESQDGRSPQRVVTGVVTGALNVKYRLNLKALVGTIFAMDKDFYFGHNLQLVIMWKPTVNFGFESKLDGTAQITTSLTTNSVSNYYLYLAEDINEDVTLPMKAAIRSSGASILVPYTVSSQLTTPAGATLQTSSIPLTPGTGLKLKRILTVPINPDSLKCTANTFNVGAVKYSALQSFIDAKPLQDMQLNWSNGDVYNFLYDHCKKSPAFLSKRIFEENAFWFDNFSDADSSPSWLENDCKLSGLDVNSAKSYALQLQQTNTAGLQLCHFQTWVRNLVIKPEGLSWGM